jgi:hypothetical protein
VIVIVYLLTFSVPPEKSVFHYEYIDGAYSVPSFFLAYSLIQLIFDVSATIIFSLIFYWGIGFKDDVGTYFMFVAVIFCILLTGEIFGSVSKHSL